jgi:hypothetical protein
MQLKTTSVIAILLAAPMMGCSTGSGFFGSAAAPPQAAAADDSQDDQKCQSSGFQLNTPAYEYCRTEITRQRTLAENFQATPYVRPQR